MMGEYDRQSAGKRSYQLTDKRSGAVYELTADEVVRVVGVEFYFIEWAVQLDGVFENGWWRVERA